MNEDNVSTDEDNDVSVVAVSSSNTFTASNLRSQESSIARFYHQLSTKTPGKPVILSLVSEYTDAYIPKTFNIRFSKTTLRII